jgi:hypothetical protein
MVIQGSLDELGRDAMAEGRYQIEVETAEPSPQLVKVIEKIKGVRKVEAKGNVLRVTTDADLRAQISKAVVQSDVALIQVKIEKFSLDDIYMKYFHEG